MRLSLRTLLAFEDNVFDVEQHRRLEQLLPTDKNAEMTLRRIRSIVRNSSLGVPGLVDHQEELDPNYVAEYLDHQMSGNVQEKFEAYCLSADKYLAEIASVHHILSNVLGEPARTSRECRHRCYNVMNPKTNSPALPVSEPPTHFRPYETPQQPNRSKLPIKRYFASLWKLLFPAKTAQATSTVPVPATAPTVPAEKKSPLWTFTLLGMFVCALLFGWQQIEKKRLAQRERDGADSNVVEYVAEENNDIFDMFPSVKQLVKIAKADTAKIDTTKTEPAKTETKTTETSQTDVAKADIPQTDTAKAEATNTDTATPDTAETEIAEASVPVAPPEPTTEPIEQVAFVTETPVPVAAPEEEVFAVITDVSPKRLAVSEPSQPEKILPNDSSDNTGIEQMAVAESIEARELAMEAEKETIIAFQPITSAAKAPAELPIRQHVLSRPSVSTWQPIEKPAEPVDVVTPQPVSIASIQQPLLVTSPITQMSATVAAPQTLGCMVQTSPSELVFSAASPGAHWQLLPLPFDLSGNQYLLTAAPFRGTFELTAGFRIEMIGDAKLCILPPDASGTSGIFVDYGRIIIHPLQPNQPLRIEMEKVRGTVSCTGQESVLFIDTFAAISEPLNNRRLPEEQGQRTGPILGFVPKNSERIAWQSVSQPQPFVTDSQGSMLLQSDRYRPAAVQLPNWLGTMPVTRDDHMLAETCRRYFAEARGDTEQALMRVVRDESQAVRTLGLRLWGDLGRFDVPIAVVAERRQGEEAIRQVLNQYFDEVMRRDNETVQSFADALKFVKESQRN